MCVMYFVAVNPWCWSCLSLITIRVGVVLRERGMGDAPLRRLCTGVVVKSEMHYV